MIFNQIYLKLLVKKPHFYSWFHNQFIIDKKSESNQIFNLHFHYLIVDNILRNKEITLYSYHFFDNIERNFDNILKRLNNNCRDVEELEEVDTYKIFRDVEELEEVDLHIYKLIIANNLKKKEISLHDTKFHLIIWEHIGRIGEDDFNYED